MCCNKSQGAATNHHKMLHKITSPTVCVCVCICAFVCVCVCVCICVCLCNLLHKITSCQQSDILKIELATQVFVQKQLLTRSNRNATNNRFSQLIAFGVSSDLNLQFPISIL